MELKSIDYDVIFDRVCSVLRENEEDDLEGIADKIVNELVYKAEISVDCIFDFAERYGCSMDYLLGRSEVYSVV